MYYTGQKVQGEMYRIIPRKTRIQFSIQVNFPLTEISFPRSSYFIINKKHVPETSIFAHSQFPIERRISRE